MNIGIKFALTYSGLSFVLLFISKFFMAELYGDVVGFLFWIYVFYAIINIVVFGIAIPIVRRLICPGWVKIAICFLIALLTMNLIPFLDTGKIITIELVKKLFGKADADLWFVPQFHLITVVGLAISALIFRGQFYQQPVVRQNHQDH